MFALSKTNKQITKVMRKQILSITAIAVAVALQSCGGEKAAETTEEPVEEVAEATPENWMVDTESSMVMWEGGTSGAQVYSHNGNIAITEGSLVTTDGSITAGKVVIDMTTIMPTDAESFSYSEQLSKEDLIGHLMSPDFFDAENHPTAMFEVTGSEGNTVNGNLTVRGKTNPESLTIESMEVAEDGSAMIKGSMTFDRQKYDVAWEHYLQDVILSDDIKLDFNITAKKA